MKWNKKRHNINVEHSILISKLIREVGYMCSECMFRVFFRGDILFVFYTNMLVFLRALSYIVYLAGPYIFVFL